MSCLPFLRRAASVLSLQTGCFVFPRGRLVFPKEVQVMVHSAHKALPVQDSRRRKKLSAIGIILVLIFICQFAMLCYFNFTQLRNHTGYDSSWNFLRAALMWDEKAFFSPAWDETTDLSLDNLLPVVSLLYGLTGNILLSFGIANTLIILLLLLFIWKILARLDVQFNPRMIALNLVICPYLTTGYSQFNDLGYFSNVLSSASYYSVKVLFVLMIIYEFLKIVQDQKIGVLGWVLWPVCLLSGFSSGVYLIIIMFIPYIAYEIETAAIRNDWKQLIRKESIFAYLCCFFVFENFHCAKNLNRLS